VAVIVKDLQAEWGLMQDIQLIQVKYLKVIFGCEGVKGLIEMISEFITSCRNVEIFGIGL
jgi:hypothetical protein